MASQLESPELVGSSSSEALATMDASSSPCDLQPLSPNAAMYKVKMVSEIAAFYEFYNRFGSLLVLSLFDYHFN